MNGGVEPSGYYNDYNVEANTISISEGGNSCGYVQFNTFPFWSGGHCYSIQNVADNVDNLYLYHYLKSNEDAIMKLRIGSGLPNIQKKDLAIFNIKLPTFEQQKQSQLFCHRLKEKLRLKKEYRMSCRNKAISIAADVHINIWCNRNFFCLCNNSKKSISSLISWANVDS